MFMLSGATFMVSVSVWRSSSFLMMVSFSVFSSCRGLFSRSFTSLSFKLGRMMTGIPFVTYSTSSRMLSLVSLMHPWLLLSPTVQGASVPWIPVELNFGVTTRKNLGPYCPGFSLRLPFSSV